MPGSWEYVRQARAQAAAAEAAAWFAHVKNGDAVAAEMPDGASSPCGSPDDVNSGDGGSLSHSPRGSPPASPAQQTDEGERAEEDGAGDAQLANNAAPTATSGAATAAQSSPIALLPIVAPGYAGRVAGGVGSGARSGPSRRRGAEEAAAEQDRVDNGWTDEGRLTFRRLEGPSAIVNGNHLSCGQDGLFVVAHWLKVEGVTR